MEVGKMEISPEIVKAGTSMATQIVKDSAQSIFDRVRTSKASKAKDETIEELHEIITELIEQRNQLVQLSQSYEEELITKKISQSDINYITESIVPLLEELLSQSKEPDMLKAKEALDTLKPVLSKDIFNILQLLGFNFKQAIGEPLTQLVNGLITSKIPDRSENAIQYKIVTQQREVEYLKVFQDEEAYERLMETFSK